MRQAINNLSLRQLRAFDAVARAGSFVRAAGVLHVTPSALTETIKQLEAALDARLIDRTTRAMWLTPAGTTFLDAARESLQCLSQGVDRMRDHAAPDDGTVTLVAAQSVLATLAVPALLAVHEAYPRMAVALMEERGRDVIRLVASGSADFGLGGWHPDAESVAAQPLFTDRVGLIGSTGDALLRKRRLRGAHLQGHVFIGLTADTAISELLRGATELPQAAREPLLRVSNTLLLQQAVQAGLGYGLVPALTARHPMVQGLTFRTLEEPVIERRIHLFTRAARSLSPAAAVVRQAILEAAGRLPMGNGLSRARLVDP
jgi:DNA-binding transcriptional LysR family regulator